jgi:hypothetical protein
MISGWEGFTPTSRHVSTIFPPCFHYLSAIFTLSFQNPMGIVFTALGLDKDMVNRGIIWE